MNQPLIACRECGKISQYQALKVNQEAACPQCNATLYVNRPDRLTLALALTVSGIIFFFFSNILPLLGLKSYGGELELHLIGASFAFWEQGFPVIAGLIILNIFLLPLFELVATLTVLLTIRWNLPTRNAIFLYRWMQELRPWGMLEVFMLGVFIAIVKLGGMATLIFGGALWSFVGLIACMFFANAVLDPFWIWQRLGGTCTPPTLTLSSLTACGLCGCVQTLPQIGEFHPHCQRCGASIRPRERRYSLEVTTALVVASAILYIPANTLPVMSFYFLGDGQPDTILSGVFRLWQSNQEMLAIIVFLASVVVPILKLITLTFLLFTIHRKSTWRPHDRMWLYKITEAIGRWSMVDIFVIAILVGLVQFGNFARVEANLGTFSFTAVVVLTMLAARTLDEKLIWDTPSNHGTQL